MRARRGFTLIELMMAITIVGILATLAVASYYTYVIRGRLAQTLTDYGHIRSVVNVETQTGGRGDLQAGSVAGEVPPALTTLLSRSEFNQLDGVTLQLVKAPAGTFAAFPNEDAYALIAAAGSEAGQRRLRVLRAVLPHSEGNKLWLTQSMLYFPLDLGPGGTEVPSTSPTEPTPATPSPVTPSTPPASPTPETPVAPTVPPATGGKVSGWDNVQTARQGTAWDAQARVCIAGSDGKPLASDLNAQVQIRVVQEVRTWDGQSTERSWLTQVPIVDGCASVAQTGSPLPVPGNEGVAALRLEVVDVFYYWPTNPDIKWDGVKPAQRIAAPS